MLNIFQCHKCRQQFPKSSIEFVVASVACCEAHMSHCYKSLNISNLFTLISVSNGEFCMSFVFLADTGGFPVWIYFLIGYLLQYIMKHCEIWSFYMITIKITVFLDGIPFILIDSHQHFGGTCCVHLVGKKRGWLSYPEDSVRFHWYIGVCQPLCIVPHPRKL